ncbi:PSP1 domain-containing protein [Runella aurantiaca]|jgi:cell fate regulator YaaT (PSP1 superfamily)|uniref:Signal peptidase-like protein n=1 Tax=Runella aurantiaca TaxID=2282308 RepID=A0A369I6W0_9BACT|nr:regulatory iron-sulfur-containing complex subunit RicT [Runella aurantiaca]RDB03975.1 Signal peptidase-like protein [Runella aurantiaca]
MSCKSCSTGGCGTRGLTEKTSGCQNNGACGTGGCNKMNVFDWLSDMDVPVMKRFDVVEVKFKGGRKEYFRNINQLDLHTGDYVVCEMASGYHIGSVSLQGDLVRLQMVKKKVANDENLKSIYRVATPRDLEKHEQSIARDLTTMYRARELVKDMKLNMKLSDVEFQSDNTKATFYYSADERVDFRELIKVLAGEFKARIEMRQISLRQEAGRLGGIGACGRELCCSTWLTDFKNITTSAARYQNLSLNPTKLSGQCGRLKCCLNYELETYIDALKDIPHVDAPLQTQKGKAHLQKTDIFKKIMWFGYENDSTTWHPISLENVNRILSLNTKGQKPVSLEVLEIEELVSLLPAPGINSDLAKMDKKFSSRDRDQQQSGNRNRNKKKKGGGGGNPSANAANPNKTNNPPKGGGEKK